MRIAPALIRSLVTVVAGLAAATPALAQYKPSCEAPPSYPQCHTTYDGCQKQPCPPPCQPPGQPPVGPPREGFPETPYTPQEYGAYVAPPRSGTTRGAVNFAGMDFGTITIPELKLRMPSIELPACFRSRSDARLVMDSGVAPWQVQGVTNAAAGRSEVILRAEVVRLQQELERRGATDPQTAEERAAAERSACEEYTQKLRQYEEQLRKINEERRALEQCIKQCLDAHNRAAEIPPGEVGCVSPRQGPQQSPQQTPYQAPEPIPQQPMPSKDSGALRFPPPAQQAVQYVEQPAAYITEPARLPTQQHWIREPAAPAGRITGLRPATR